MDLKNGGKAWQVILIEYGIRIWAEDNKNNAAGVNPPERGINNGAHTAKTVYKNIKNVKTGELKVKSIPHSAH